MSGIPSLLSFSDAFQVEGQNDERTKIGIIAVTATTGEIVYDEFRGGQLFLLIVYFLHPLLKRFRHPYEDGIGSMYLFRFGNFAWPQA